MSIFCPSCLHVWIEDDNDEKIRANGIKCKYCDTFFVDMNFVGQILKENGVKIDFKFKHINDGDHSSARK